MRDIAERTGLPQPYLEQILLALKGAGLVRSKRGVGGGYVLARAPSEIRLSEIVSAVDGPITLGDFGQPHQDGACDHEGQCVLIAVWNEAGEHMRHHLDGYTLADGGRDGQGRRRLARRTAGTAPTASPAERQPQAARNAARSAGSGLSNVTRSPVTGWSNDSSAAWRNGRVRPSVGAPVAVGRVADERVADGAEVDADLVRAPGLQPARQPGQLGRRVVARRRPRTRSAPACRRRPPPSSADRDGSRPIGASMMPCGASGWPQTTAS